MSTDEIMQMFKRNRGVSDRAATRYAELNSAAEQSKHANVSRERFPVISSNPSDKKGGQLTAHEWIPRTPRSARKAVKSTVTWVENVELKKLERSESCKE